MILEFPQLAIIALDVIGLVIIFDQCNSSKPPAVHSPGWTAVAIALVMWLLYEGKFFVNSGVPQLIIVVYYAFILGRDMVKQGQPQYYNIFASTFLGAMTLGVLYAGGFFGKF